jgi:hypothetical protein
MLLAQLPECEAISFHNRPVIPGVDPISGSAPDWHLPSRLQLHEDPHNTSIFFSFQGFLYVATTMQPTAPTFMVFCLWMINVFMLVVINTVTGYCPTPCNCRDTDGAIEVNCESMNLEHVPILKRQSKQSMAGILLGHNKISTVYSSTFGGVQARYIILSGNPLSIIAHDAFSHIRQLHLLSLESCGLNEVNFYPKFSATTKKYYLNMNRNNISIIAKDFVGEVVRRSIAHGKRFYIELERNKLKSLDFIGDVCRVRQAHLVNVNVKENPLNCDCNLHAVLYKVGDRLKINGRCSTPRQYKNDPINVFMEKGRIQCNRTCFTDDVIFDCNLRAWTYETNKTCRALPVCKNGEIKCYEPMAGSVRTALSGSASRTELTKMLGTIVLILTAFLWTKNR